MSVYGGGDYEDLFGELSDLRPLLSFGRRTGEEGRVEKHREGNNMGMPKGWRGGLTITGVIEMDWSISSRL
jgi:hypothetical protein